MPNSTEFLTVREVCNMLQISRSTVYLWIKLGILKPDVKVRKVMRFDKAKIVKSLKVGGEDEGQHPTIEKGEGSMAEGSKEGT